MERDYRTEHFGHKPASVFPYVTKEITGEPIEIRSLEHQREVCKQHGVRLRDDAAWVDEQVESEVYRAPDGRIGTNAGELVLNEFKHRDGRGAAQDRRER
jgi:hypothetical protein